MLWVSHTDTTIRGLEKNLNPALAYVIAVLEWSNAANAHGRLRRAALSLSP